MMGEALTKRQINFLRKNQAYTATTKEWLATLDKVLEENKALRKNKGLRPISTMPKDRQCVQFCVWTPHDIGKCGTCRAVGWMKL